MPPKKNPPLSASRNTSISVGGDVNGNIVVGDHNTVNQTIIQKFFNIFKSDAETTNQRNRRIMLGHVENFWVKGILEKSLHGAALLDLGIKEDPDALNYPWAIKREANKETLPAGTSVLEIFEEIGMGRSLLILGTPGSGKTTMLLELTRQLIERAREDVTEPIPVVFNLSSWTEKLTLADWLARELNVIYTIPKKVAPTWVKENKMLLLLDGLDEVRQESRDKCVEAINQFRKENGLTSLAVCSRSQDYADLKANLSFDGAIEIQPLTSNQVDEYFERFGNGLQGIKQVLAKDSALREMAETPLFLSIMALAYRDTQSNDILVSENLDIQRKHLFDTYIERMFERSERTKNERFKKQDVLHWLSWLANKIIEHKAIPYFIENMLVKWVGQKKRRILGLMFGLVFGLIFGPIIGLVFGVIGGQNYGLKYGLISGVIGGLIAGLTGWQVSVQGGNGHGEGLLYEIKMVDISRWDWKGGLAGMAFGLMFGVIFGGVLWRVVGGLSGMLSSVLISGLVFGLIFGFDAKPVSQTTYPGQRISLSIRNSFFILLFSWLIIGLIIGLIYGLYYGLIIGLIVGLIVDMMVYGPELVNHYSLRLAITFNNYLPWKLIPFLNYCTDLIFLRRVGGGYIFVHRLLMEHFADMYPENAQSLSDVRN